jgi:hypothetical protein
LDRGPSPGTASGHPGEAWRAVVAGPRQPRLKGSQGPKRAVHLRIIWKSFMGGYRLHFQSGTCRNGQHQMGGGRGPRSGHCQQSYVKFKWGGRKGLGYPGEPGLSDSDVSRSVLGHPRRIRPKRPGSSQRHRGVPRPCGPHGALTLR